MYLEFLIEKWKRRGGDGFKELKKQVDVGTARYWKASGTFTRPEQDKWVQGSHRLLNQE